jgi:hypothetical protein
MARVKRLYDRKQAQITSICGLGLIIPAFSIFQPIVGFVVRQEVDYTNHLSYLQTVLDGAPLSTLLAMFPHFLFHLLVYLVYRIIPGSTLIDAAYVVTLGAYLALAIVLFWLMGRLTRPTAYATGIFYGVVTLTLMLVMPINIFTPTNLYLGYIVIHAYHNPTIVLLKPFAVISFYIGAKVFRNGNLGESKRDRPRTTARAAVISALLTVLCILAKPNYIIVLVPALIVMAAYCGVRKRAVDWRLLTVSILLPTAVVLGLEALVFKNTGGLVFAPLAVMNSWNGINPNASSDLGLKFILSILFPLLVYVSYFPEARRNVYLNLAWLTFAFGASYTYLLAESGERLGHANFTWSGQISLFMLFITSTIFFIQQIQERKTAYFRSPAALACSAAFGLHLVSGLYWYYLHVTSIWMGDIIANKW